MIAVDTNLLIYAHRGSVPEHDAARRAIEKAAGLQEGWGFSIANVLEFWSVVTHPAAAGRPSTASEARNFLENLIDSGGAALWLPLDGFGARMLDTAAQLQVVGPRIFDLQIAMTALDNGARSIWTHDRGFIQVPGLPVHDPLKSELS